jgi:hypothetical protein
MCQSAIFAYGGLLGVLSSCIHMLGHDTLCTFGHSVVLDYVLMKLLDYEVSFRTNLPIRFSCFKPSQ